MYMMYESTHIQSKQRITCEVSSLLPLLGGFWIKVNECIMLTRQALYPLSYLSSS